MLDERADEDGQLVAACSQKIRSVRVASVANDLDLFVRKRRRLSVATAVYSYQADTRTWRYSLQPVKDIWGVSELAI